MDEAYLLACARYVELNPVRAGLARRARDWKWSSARAHLSGRDDGLVKAEPLLAMVPDWPTLLRQRLDDNECDAIRAAGRTGRPLGSERFTARLEKRLGRRLARAKPGSKPSGADE